MTNIMSIGEEQTMSSREIAALTGKRHDHVCRDIVKLEISYEEMSLPKVGEREYRNERGQTYREFLLTKLQCFDLMTGYSAELRIKVNRRWNELENSISLPDFTNPAAAARAWADEVEKKQIAEGKADALQIELDREKEWYSVKRVKLLGLLPDVSANKIWRPLKEWCILNNVQIRSIFDANYGDVKTYHARAWNAVYNLDLYFNE